jgi:phosphate transport system substrate-binding protein
MAGPSIDRRAFGTALVAIASGCARRRDKRTLRISGSDTMVLLGQRWAEAFMRGHPGTSIQVSGGGTGAGIAALVAGTTDLCAASRRISASERASVERARGVAAVERIVAYDALTLYVNEANAVAALDVAQLADVFRGRHHRWSALGGADVPITCYGRESDSGSYEFFREHVLGGADYAPEVQALVGTAAVVSAVKTDVGGIGYGGVAYAKGVRALPIRPTPDAAPIAPTRGSGPDERYPFARPLFVYTAGPAVGLV